MKKFLTSLFIILSFYGLSQVNLGSGLQAYYPFNGNANDESGNGNDGIVNGATLTLDRNGETNSAYNFDGQKDDIILPSFPKLDNATFSFWFRPIDLLTNSSKPMVFLESDKVGDTKGDFLIAFNRKNCGSQESTNDGKIYFELQGDFQNRNSNCKDFGLVNVSTQINTWESDKWYNVISVLDQDSIYIYINGIKQGAQKVNSQVFRGNIPLTLGVYKNQQIGESPFNGVLDDLRIYNRALIQEEITQLASNKPTPPIVESLTECDNVPLILIAQGENIKWYADEAKTNLVFEGNSYAPTSPQKEEKNYWVTQTVNGIESDATKATLTVLASVIYAHKPTTTSLVEFCQGNVSSSEVSIGTIPNAESYDWILTPQNAGTISGQGHKITINWSVDFFGEATIKVARKNANCGLGKESEGLKFNILEKPNVASNLNNYIKDCDGKYIVLDAGSGYDFYLWNTGSTEQIEVIKSDFVGNGNHTYSVTATKGACSTTENVTVFVDLVTSAPSLVIEKSNVNVYPNPANDQLNIDFDNIHNEEVLTFELVNTNGNVVLQEKITVFDKNFSHSTNINGISSGLYIIKIQGNIFTHQAKVIIE